MDVLPHPADRAAAPSAVLVTQARRHDRKGVRSAGSSLEDPSGRCSSRSHSRSSPIASSCVRTTERRLWRMTTSSFLPAASRRSSYWSAAEFAWVAADGHVVSGRVALTKPSHPRGAPYPLATLRRFWCRRSISFVAERTCSRIFSSRPAPLILKLFARRNT